MTEGKARRIDYSPDEYISGVAGVLKADEQGVYWMICTLIMSEGGPVPFNENRLAMLCGARRSRIREIVAKLVSLGKVTLRDGNLGQKRAESEIERSVNRIERARENGKNGGRPKLKSEENQQEEKAAGFSEQKLTTNYQQPTTTVSEPNGSSSETSSDRKPARKRKSYPQGFEAAWAAYPTDANMSKLEAFEAWEKLDDKDRETLMASIPAFKAYLAKNPELRTIHMNRYIKFRRFEGHAGLSSPSPIGATVTETDWIRRLRYGRHEHRWSRAQWGPAPGEAGSLVPSQLIEPGDGAGWSDLEAAA